uniref:Uncharacterized protein n=1 Tax=Plectus sambesii TaxID=2011161 RepID=A0A914VY25_9BILA
MESEEAMPMADGGAMPMDMSTPAPGQEQSATVLKVRSEFPEAWIWIDASAKQAWMSVRFIFAWLVQFAVLRICFDLFNVAQCVVDSFGEKRSYWLAPLWRRPIRMLSAKRISRMLAIRMEEFAAAPGPVGAAGPPPPGAGGAGGGGGPPPVTVRTNFPEAWIWSDLSVK